MTQYEITINIAELKFYLKYTQINGKSPFHNYKISLRYLKEIREE